MLDEEGYSKILLTRKGSVDHWVSACPLIMASYALEQKRRGFAKQQERLLDTGLRKSKKKA